MSDQCRYCEAYEKLNLCKSFDCFHHESWYAKEQSKLIEKRDAAIAEMRESLTECVQLLYNSGHVLAARKITTLLKANS